MVAIITHDAGGAEILSSWVKESQINFCTCLDGPALKIFENKNIKFENLSIEDAINKSKWVLCGTSWMSDLEIKAIVLSKKLNKKVIVFLDHWTNYIERFEKDNQYFFPDEIWVGDDYAFELASKLFENKCKVVLKNNPYFSDIKNSFKNSTLNKINDSFSNTILYVCEPIKKHALMKYGDELYWGYNEDLAIDYFFSSLYKLNMSNYQIVIRPHPSEEDENYQWVLKKYQNHAIKIGGKKSLMEEISASNIIVGCSSMAMVIGLLMDKKVFSTIPPGRGTCTLPFKEIQFIRNL